MSDPIQRRRSVKRSSRAITGRDWVALILAIGIATSVNFITLAVMYDAVANSGSQLSENATQILVAAFGGIIGILGSYIGFRAAQQAQTERDGQRPTPGAEPPEDS